MPTRVKICGLTRAEDVDACVRAGVDAVGFVFYPKSPRNVDPVTASALIHRLPPFVSSVGLFVDADPDWLAAVLDITPLNLLQFHGDESPEDCRRYRRPYLKAIRVKPGVDLVECALRYHDAVALLLDAYVEGQPGGTGQRFDWQLIPRTLSRPIVLSGGLDADNVGWAMDTVRPSAVDVSSGVEMAKGIKDGAKIAAFMEGVRRADV